MASYIRDPKDPDDVDTFSVDWTNRLGSETISTLAVSAVSGCTVDSSSTSGAVTTATVSGGTAGVAAVVRFRITTSGGRQLDETVTIPVEAR